MFSDEERELLRELIDERISDWCRYAEMHPDIPDYAEELVLYRSAREKLAQGLHPYLRPSVRDE
jgi:hypothetical protein